MFQVISGILFFQIKQRKKKIGQTEMENFEELLSRERAMEDLPSVSFLNLFSLNMQYIFRFLCFKKSRRDEYQETKKVVETRWK